MAPTARRAIEVVCAAMLLAAGGPGARAEDAPPPANPPAGESARPPESQPPAKHSGPAGGQAAPAADALPPAPAAGKGGQAASGEKPAPEGAAPEPAAPQWTPGPPLQATGIGALEMLPRDYEATARFYVEVLGFREEDASGGAGERRCTLVCGPVRLVLREQPGRPMLARRPPWLGVHPAPLSEVTAEAAGLKEPKGVLVEDLVPQGPAGIAGIVKGDIILAVEGKGTASPNELTQTVRGFPVDKRVLVTLWREGKKRDIPVQLPASPFPEQLGPVVLRLEVRDLEGYHHELLRRNIRVYAEPRDDPAGGRVLELVDPNDLLIVLEEPRPAATKPAPSATPAGAGKGPTAAPPAPASEDARGEPPVPAAAPATAPVK